MKLAPPNPTNQSTGAPVWCVKRQWVFRGWLGVVEGVVADHGVQGQDAAVGQGEDGLVVTFPLLAFALVVGLADGVGAQ